MMMVGYPNSHHGDCYTMYNFDTNRRVESRDITWCNRMYFAPDGEPTKDPLITLEREPHPERADGYVNLGEDGLFQIEDAYEDANVRFSENDEIIYLGETGNGHGAAPAVEAPPVPEDGNERRYPLRTRTQRPIYNPDTGHDTDFSSELHAVQNYSNAIVLSNSFGVVQNFQNTLAELDNAEVMEDTRAQNRYYETQGIGFEISAVGAGVGGGFTNTAELAPIQYREAMSGPKAEVWAKECDNEHE